MRGYVVNVYSPEQLKQMTPEEVNDHIREDVWEDAFDRQLAMPYRYKGKDLAKDSKTRSISARNAENPARCRSEECVFLHLRLARALYRNWLF